MMRQSVQTVLPESTGNNTLSLRDSVCRDLFQLFSSPHSPLPILLVSGMPEWQGHNQSDKLLQSWYCRQLRSALLFHEPRIAALQVNLKEAYCHELAISLEMMLYHDDEPLTFDLVWQKELASHDAAVNDGKRDTRKTYRVRSQLVEVLIAAFKAGSRDGLALSLSIPMVSSRAVCWISPAISPHILTGISLLRPA